METPSWIKLFEKSKEQLGQIQNVNVKMDESVSKSRFLFQNKKKRGQQKDNSLYKYPPSKEDLNVRPLPAIPKETIDYPVEHPPYTKSPTTRTHVNGRRGVQLEDKVLT